MNSRLTLSDVRTQLSYLVDPSNPNNPQFNNLLNEVCERYMYSGKWKGALVKVHFDQSSGFITLPFQYLSILNGTWDKVPFPTFGEYHTYQENGPGDSLYTDNQHSYCGVLVDLGDGFVTLLDIPSTATGIYFLITDANDAGKQILVQGSNNGTTIYSADGSSGTNITLANPVSATYSPITAITGIQKPLTRGIVHLYAVTTPTDTLLASYQPSETRPMYRRYKTGTTDKKIRLLCQRRFIPLQNETDYVIPGNLSALRAGLQALQYELNSDDEKAEIAWNRGLKFLNNEMRAARGGSKPPYLIQHFGSGTPFPWTN
jgi:hypothetical protein